MDKTNKDWELIERCYMMASLLLVTEQRALCFMTWVCLWMPASLFFSLQTKCKYLVVDDGEGRRFLVQNGWKMKSCNESSNVMKQGLPLAGHKQECRRQNLGTCLYSALPLPAKAIIVLVLSVSDLPSQKRGTVSFSSLGDLLANRTSLGTGQECYQHQSHTESRTQQALCTSYWHENLSQPKSGHWVSGNRTFLVQDFSAQTP